MAVEALEAGVVGVLDHGLAGHRVLADASHRTGRAEQLETPKGSRFDRFYSDGFLICGAAHRQQDPAAGRVERQRDRLRRGPDHWPVRSEEHTSELQSLMRNAYAVFCLKKQQIENNTNSTQSHER